MAVFFKFEQFVEDCAHKVHDLGSDDLQLYCSNVAPDAGADAVKADLAEISTGNGYSGPTSVTGVTSSQSGGTYTLDFNSITPLVAASGGSVTFRYVVLFNTTPTSPLDPLIGAYDYGVGGITLNDGEELDFNVPTTILTLA